MTPSEIIKAAEELAKEWDSAASLADAIYVGANIAEQDRRAAALIRSLIALVPGEGTVAVPEEPTDVIISTLLKGSFSGSKMREAYKAMLKAAKEGK